MIIDILSEKTIKILFSCKSKDIVYLNNIIDSYENIGLMRTVNNKKLNCILFTTNGMKNIALKIIDKLKNEGVKISNIVVEENENIDI